MSADKRSTTVRPPENSTSTNGPESQGLSSKVAAARLAADGQNRLPGPKQRSMILEFVSQLVHFFALMLWVAGGLALLAGMPQLGIAIFVVIVVNGTFAFAQEFRAERAANQLNDLLPKRAVVFRDGAKQNIEAVELVVGDVVVLRAGDMISADLEVTTAAELRVDTSMLTGESEPMDAGAADALFAGCFVVSGAGLAVVVATGDATRLASIASLTQGGKRPRSPLERELGRVVRAIAIIAVGVGTSFFVISLLVGGSARDGFLFAVGVTVALVPEGLLPTVTLSLAAGAKQMARHHALVRHLESVETLGSTTFICTDKTGTITKNQMSVVEVWTPEGSATVVGDGYDPDGVVTVEAAAHASLIDVAASASICCDDGAIQREGSWVPEGDPMEAALWALARRCVPEDRVSARAWTHAFPFDSTRRMMSVIVDGRLLVKGAPESVLPRCSPIAGSDDAVTGFTHRGLRVLAIAARPIGEVPADASAGAVEVGLTLLGLVALQDPPRDGVNQALAATRAAGIRVAMLTGDNAETAAAIAREVGLLSDEGIVLSGPELPTDHAILGALVDRPGGVVISRVTPEDKLAIARSLQHRSHVVAMTGDGVNDGPALQAADIGIAMGASGTDVARAAADLVLLDDDFRTIVTAVQLGRATFANMRRFLTYHLVCNVAELTPFVIWAISGGRFPLILGVLQILCFDLGADVLPALALGVERDRGSSLDLPLQGRHLIDRKVIVRVFAVLGVAESAMEVAAFLAVLLTAGWVPGDSIPTGHVVATASGAAFATVIFCQVGVAFACRSATVWPGRLGWFTNPLLLYGVAVAVVLLACFEFIPPLANVLGQAPPPLVGWLVALAGVPVMLGIDLLHKRLRFRRRRPREAPTPAATFTVLPAFASPVGV